MNNHEARKTKHEAHVASDVWFLKAGAREYRILNRVPHDDCSVRLFLAGARETAMLLGKKPLADAINVAIGELMAGVPATLMEIE